MFEKLARWCRSRWPRGAQAGRVARWTDGHRTDHDARVASTSARADAQSAAGVGPQRQDPAAGTRRTAGGGACLRRVPHRPACHRGRPCRCTATAVTPGHEVVGEVVAVGVGRRRRVRSGGPGRRRLAAPHLRGVQLLPARRREPVPESRYTGWDADGGYAEFATVPAAFAHRLPERLQRQRACAAAVRRDHRLPVAAARRAATRAAGWGCTASAAAPTSPPRSRWRRAPRST